MVNGENQRPATGRCLEFVRKDGWSAVFADAGAIYPNIIFHRAAFLIGNDLVVFIDHFRIRDDGNLQDKKWYNNVFLDIAVHPNDALIPKGDPMGANSEKPGYSYLRDLKGHFDQYTDRPALELLLAPEGKTPAALTFPASSGSSWSYSTGTGVGRNTEDRVPIVIAHCLLGETDTYGKHLPWAIATRAPNGAPKVIPVDIMDESVDIFTKKRYSIRIPSVAAARVTHNGKTYLVIANPEGRHIKVGDEWSGKDTLVVKEVR